MILKFLKMYIYESDIHRSITIKQKLNLTDKREDFISLFYEDKVKIQIMILYWRGLRDVVLRLE